MDDHSQHICEEKRCPFRCILCSEQCIDERHDHNKFALEIDGKKIHLCGNSHECLQNCELDDGVCRVDYEQISKKWKTSFSEKDYEAYVPIERRRKCRKVIPPG